MDIKNVYDAIIFTSAALTLKEAVIEAISKKANLHGANLREANLYGADLREANLHGADLREANLRRANLREANLHGADLREANLRHANLPGANLREANLHGADLREANLHGANLREANLYGADLREANLREANLHGADLHGADLREANLRRANLHGANLREAKGTELALAQLQFIPETGAFDGWKKCKDGIIVKLSIPEDAERSHGSERKARASKAIVVEVFGAEIGISGGGYETIEYRKGETVFPDSWDEDRWNVCSHGVHFFLTRIEAEEYSF